MQKFRSDISTMQKDGARVWSASWMGGHTLAKIDNCRLENLAGNMRRTVYLTDNPDTFFSIPAVCRIAGARVRGYVTTSDCDCKALVFRQTYY